LPDAELRSRVQQRIEDGRLPLLRPERIEAGYGSEDKCCACGEPIEPSKIEYEIAALDGQRLKFHFACYMIWQSECSRRLRAPRG